MPWITLQAHATMSIFVCGFGDQIHILMLAAEELYQQSYLSLCPKVKS